MSHVTGVKANMLVLPRGRLLQAIAMGIHELTILGRYYRNEPDELRSLRHVNEAIHRLSGHLRDLCNPNEPYTASRGDGIGEQLEVLPDSMQKRLYEFTT